MKPFSPDGQFRLSVQAGQGELRRLTVRGAGSTIFAGAFTLVVQMVATMVLARLLSPVDFGLVTMVTTFSLLLVNFGFNGFTELIVQREEVDHALATNIFWINLAFGIVLTLGFWESGWLLARFYHDALIKQVTEGISLTIVATSLSTVHLALLKRAMHFTWVSVNDIAARAIYVIVSIALALMHWGYWALVAGAVALPVSTCIGAYLMCRWMPGRPRRVAGTGSALQFALHTYGNFGINYASRNSDNLLVGWRFNAQSLGFYKKAYDLFALSANQLVASISIVVVAGLSRVKKDMTLYRKTLLDAVSVMAFIGMGLSAVLTLIGKDLIQILLGPKWGPAGQIFTFFGPGIGAMVLYYMHGWIHLSIGRPDRWMRWAVVEFAVTILLFIAGLPWGPEGIAIAWSVSFWVLTIPAIWYAGRPINLGVRPVLAVVWRYVVASLVATLATIFILSHTSALGVTTSFTHTLLRIMVICALAGPLYIGGVVLLYRNLAPVYQIANLLREMMHSGKAEGGELPMSSSAHVLAVAGNGSAESADLPLVSILIPAYNAQEWIADTIRSALAQTWPRIEIVVVDDGSKDQTVAVARQFESQNVRVIAQKNQGASAARNNAFMHSKGDYIQWLDADDLLAPDKVTSQMELVMQGLDKHTLLSGSWGRFMYRPNRAKFVPSSLWCDLSPKEWLLRKMGQNNYMQTATWLVSREVTEATGPWDVRLLGDDDGEYFCRALMASNGVRFVPSAKVYYRAFRFNSLSYIGRFPERIEAHWMSMKLHISYLRSFGDDCRIDEACLQYLCDSLMYFFPDSPHIVQQADEMAASFGGQPLRPKLSWKYSWIERLFGSVVTRPTQDFVRKTRWYSARKLDLLLSQVEDRIRKILRQLQVAG
jgi:PST family polysaccharide transporter